MIVAGEKAIDQPTVQVGHPLEDTKVADVHPREIVRVLAPIPGYLLIEEDMEDFETARLPVTDIVLEHLLSRPEPLVMDTTEGGHLCDEPRRAGTKGFGLLLYHGGLGPRTVKIGHAMPLGAVVARREHGMTYQEVRTLAPLAELLQQRLALKGPQEQPHQKPFSPLLVDYRVPPLGSARNHLETDLHI